MRFELDAFYVHFWVFLRADMCQMVLVRDTNAYLLYTVRRSVFRRYGGSQQATSLRLCLVFSCYAVDMGSASCKTVWGEIPNNIVQILF